MKNTIYTALVVSLAMAFYRLPLSMPHVYAQQATCPHTDPWVKIDGLTGTSYTYTAPVGMIITQVCYKAATEVIYLPGNNQNSMTIVSTVTNQNNQVQDLSHASFELAVDPSPSPDPSAPVTPPVTPTPDPSTTPTPAPSNNNSNNDSGSNNSSSNNSSNENTSSGEVLGAYAGTGVATDAIMNTLGAFGSLMTTVGSVMYGKKKTFKRS